MQANSVPRAAPLDIDTLRWVLGRLGSPDVTQSVTVTQKDLPTWDYNLACQVQLNPEMMPLSGDEPKILAKYLRDVAHQIETGLWDQYMFSLGRIR